MDKKLEDQVLDSEVMSDDDFRQLSQTGAIIQYPDDPDLSTEDETSKKLDQTLDKAFEDLSNDLDLDKKPIASAVEALDDISKVTNEDQKAFDLMASKTLKTVNSRVRAKSILAANILMEKMSSMISKMDENDFAADPMSFLTFMTNYTDYIERLDRLQKRYDDSTVDESLRKLSEDNRRKSEDNSNDLSKSEYADIVAKALESIRNGE